MSMVFLGDSKRCSRCKQYKPFSEYHKNKSGQRGTMAQCKECRRASWRKYRSREDQFWKFFWSHVERVGECLEWKGWYKSGHPACNYKEQKTQFVRRIVYRLTRGELPDDMRVLVTCSNPRCVSQYHMHLGTKADVEVKRANSMPTGNRNGTRTHPETRPRGEQNRAARLTESDVRAIRDEYARGAASLRVLAARYNVTARAVGDVVNNRTWSHII